MLPRSTADHHHYLLIPSARDRTSIRQPGPSLGLCEHGVSWTRVQSVQLGICEGYYWTIACCALSSSSLDHTRMFLVSWSPPSSKNLVKTCSHHLTCLRVPHCLIIQPAARAELRNAVANNSYFCLSWVGWVDINIPRCLPRSLSNQGQWIKLCLLNRIHWIQYSMSSLMWTLGRCWDQSHRQTRGFLNSNWFSNLSPVILGPVSVTMRTLSQTPAPRLRRMLSDGEQI